MTPLRPSLRRPPASRQRRGSVLLFGLIAMTILLISAVALVRSFNGSLFNAGNVAFKRDVLNQADRVWPLVLADLRSGALSTPDKRAANVPASNYSASVLQSIHSPSIPEALLDDGTFGSLFNRADMYFADQQVTIRYVVDRLCSQAGAEAVLGAAGCTLADGGVPAQIDAFNTINAGTTTSGGVGALTQQVVYRISIRVTGPRNTQAFFQTTFSL